MGLKFNPLTGQFDIVGSGSFLPTQTGNSGKFLKTDGTNPSWDTPSATVTPAGSDTQVQFNDGGALGADSGLVFDKTTDALSVAGSIILPTGATGTLLYNTADQTTNYELGALSWNTNILQLATSKGGTGVARDLNIKTPLATLIIKGASASPVIDYDINSSSTITQFIRLTNGTIGGASTAITQTAVVISPAFNQSSTAAWRGLLINVTDSGTSSGAKTLQEWQLGGTLKAILTSDGRAGFGATVPTGVGLYTNGTLRFDSQLFVGHATEIQVRDSAGNANTRGISGLNFVRAGGTGDSYISGTGNFGVGTSTVSAKIHALSTTEQLRLGYDTSNYFSSTVASNGAVTLNAVGAGASFTFSDDVSVPDEAYGVGWDSSLEVPTKNAVYDKVQGYAAETKTFTNTRVTPRTGTTTSSATPTINTDNIDYYDITAQAVDITSFTTNLSGTPTLGQKLIIAIKGTGARAITWGASFEASTVALPTTTVTTARLIVGFIWTGSIWTCVAVC